MHRIVLCFVMCLLVYVQGALKDCGSKIGSYTNVTITNCNPDNGACILKRNSSATITIVFNIDQDVSQVNAFVHGIIGGAPIPFPLSQPNACSRSGLSCPLEKGKGPFQYNATLAVERFYPRIKVTVKWELKDENNQVIVCVLIPSEIK